MDTPVLVETQNLYMNCIIIGLDLGGRELISIFPDVLHFVTTRGINQTQRL